MSEFSTLADFGEGMQDVSDTAFGAFAFHSLPALEAEFGRDSEEYKTAVLALKAALATVRFFFLWVCPHPWLNIGTLVDSPLSGPQTWLSSSSIPKNLLALVVRRPILPLPSPLKLLSQPSRPAMRLFTPITSAILPQNLV